MTIPTLSQSYDCLRIARKYNMPYGAVLDYADVYEAWALGLARQHTFAPVVQRLQRALCSPNISLIVHEIAESVRRSPYYAARYATARRERPGDVRDDVAPRG